METIKTGLVGFGYSGLTFHWPFIHCLEPYELTSALSSNPERVHQSAPTAQVFSDYDDFLASDVDLVIITAPNEFHFPMAKAALEAGKHVVLEKPFVNTTAEGEALIELANQQGKILSVYHNRRWDGDFLTVKKLVENKTLGNLAHFESHFDRFRPTIKPRWRERPGPGTGMLYDLGPHLIDQCLVLFGKPNSLSAQVIKQRANAEVDDYFHIVMDYGKFQAILHVTVLSAKQAPRFTLHGDQGSFIKYGEDRQERDLKAGMMPNQTPWGIEDESNQGLIVNETQQDTHRLEAGCYQNYYNQLAEAIRGNGPNPVPAEQALDSIRLIELAQQSSDEKRSIILQDHEAEILSEALSL